VTSITILINDSEGEGNFIYLLKHNGWIIFADEAIILHFLRDDETNYFSYQNIGLKFERTYIHISNTKM
jgi:hypothetical protein